MTLEEKVGQLTQIGGVSFPERPSPDEALRKGGAGSVLWLNDAKQFNRLQKIAVEESRLKIPLLFGLDVIHGYRTIFPMPLAMAASWDPAVDRAGADDRGARGARRRHPLDLRAHGRHRARRALGPHRRGRGRGSVPRRGHGGARRCAASRATTLGRPDRVLACAKHFAGYGAAEGGRDYDSVYMPESQLRNVYLPPFRAAARGRRRHLHERLHGPQRRAGHRQPLPAAATCCARSGASRASW